MHPLPALLDFSASDYSRDVTAVKAMLLRHTRVLRMRMLMTRAVSAAQQHNAQHVSHVAHTTAGLLPCMHAVLQHAPSVLFRAVCAQ